MTSSGSHRNCILGARFKYVTILSIVRPEPETLQVEDLRESTAPVMSGPETLQVEDQRESPAPIMPYRLKIKYVEDNVLHMLTHVPVRNRKNVRNIMNKIKVSGA